MSDKDPLLMRHAHGFYFGAANVTACTTLPRGRAVVQIQTPNRTLQVIVTKTGRMRVWFNGFEVLLTK